MKQLFYYGLSLLFSKKKRVFLKNIYFYRRVENPVNVFKFTYISYEMVIAKNHKKCMSIYNATLEYFDVKIKDIAL